MEGNREGELKTIRRRAVFFLSFCITVVGVGLLACIVQHVDHIALTGTSVCHHFIFRFCCYIFIINNQNRCCGLTRREFLREILYKNIAIIAIQRSKIYFVDTFGDFSHNVE